MRLRIGALWLALVILAVAVYLVTDHPAIEHTSALNAVFDTRWMVAAARLLTVAAIVYVVASIAVRAQRGQWVRSAGPVDTDAPIQAIADSQEELQRQLRDAHVVIAELEEQLTAARTTIQTLGASVLDPPVVRQAQSSGAGTEVADDTDS